MNKINEQTETSPNSDAIKFKPQKTLLLHTHSKLSTSSIEEEVDREHFHWGATAEVMKSSEGEIRVRKHGDLVRKV